MKVRVVFLLLCCIWGSTWMFIKLGLRDLPPVSFAAARFLLATAILSAVVAARRARLPRGRAEWGLIALSGVLAFGLNYGLLFWGEQHISSGLAALLQATIPVFGMLLAHPYLPGERLNARKLAGAAFVAWANVLVKAKGTRLDASVLAAGQMACGFLALAAVALALEGDPRNLRWTPLAVGCLLYLTLVGSVAAFLLFYWLVRHVDVTKTMLIALVTPLAAVLLGVAALGEEVSWRTVAGGLTIMSGVALVVLRRAPKAPAVAAPESLAPEAGAAGGET